VLWHELYALGKDPWWDFNETGVAMFIHVRVVYTEMSKWCTVLKMAERGDPPAGGKLQLSSTPRLGR
jgi:hypothetical protein